jgi:DNA-binding CsgD family transcriptional regulator
MLHMSASIHPVPQVPTAESRVERVAQSAYAGPERRSDSASAAAAAPWFAPMLDEIDHGMLLLNARLEVLHVNHVARSEMGEHHPLRMAGGGLMARHRPDEAPLHEALQSAARRGLRCLLTIGEHPHAVNLAVVPLTAVDARQAPAMLVMLGKRVFCSELAVQWFARNHALTQAETRVLSALCDGSEPSHIACALGTSLHTVRTQISSVRAKTGAGTIRELIRQVSMLPPLVSALRSSARTCPDGPLAAAQDTALPDVAGQLDCVDESLA